jgi:hypothetical protein
MDLAKLRSQEMFSGGYVNHVTVVLAPPTDLV